ncbi:MAG: SDR family oxidoreductase [Flammeovirgaceae bacterium]|jgi:NAD(P)-dependent dehydrogenase (short-subunit alcohol dehydrogenase family)|nr:SDR family oxidoreductase [Flammeovirgaceae bacterium]|tara:strand:- start:6948 stop:7742 length:795 start_codon:yes stop_codon:yes gene_type:complete
MDLQLTGKTAFITGSTSGIGFAAARALAMEGVRVILNGRDAAGVSSAIERMKKIVHHGRIEGMVADFSKPDQIKLLLDQLPEVHILINNVGIYTSDTFFDTTDEDWQHQMEVNLMSGVRLSRRILPQMLNANWGRILFLSSECATLVPADLIAYSTTKAALQALSRGLAQLTVGSGVTVNIIVPGSTLTEGAVTFLEKVAAAENKTPQSVSKEFFTNVRTSSLLQRFATVEEVASTIVYFASPLAAATNGAVIKVDGGSSGGIL